MEEEAFIIDIDGTIADPAHRLHLWPKNEEIRKGNAGTSADWEAFLSQCDRDEPIQEIIDLVQLVASYWDLTPLYVTGRELKWYEKTMRWLREYELPPGELFMRPLDDNRQDHVVKAEIYENYIKNLWDVMFVLEDRTQVVEMWRGKDLRVLQVAKGDF